MYFIKYDINLNILSPFTPISSNTAGGQNKNINRYILKSPDKCINDNNPIIITSQTNINTKSLYSTIPKNFSG